MLLPVLPFIPVRVSWLLLPSCVCVCAAFSLRGTTSVNGSFDNSFFHLKESGGTLLCPGGAFVTTASLWSDIGMVRGVALQCSDGSFLPSIGSTVSGDMCSWNSTIGYKSIGRSMGTGYNSNGGSCCGGDECIPGAMDCPSGQLFAGYSKFIQYNDYLGNFTTVCNTPCPTGFYCIGKSMIACGSATYQDTIGQTTCKSCPVNTIQSPGGTSCTGNKTISENDSLRISCWDDAVFGEYPYPEHKLTYRNCLKSRINYGDPTRLRAALHKLKQGNCINIAVIGGSISIGHGANTIYHYELLKWLTKTFDCSKTGDGHQLFNLARTGTASDSFANEMLEEASLHDSVLLKADILIVETASNDISELNSPHGSQADGIKYFTEMIIRTVRTFFPQIAIVYLGAAWRCHNFDDEKPYFCSAVNDHLLLTKYYNIDHISMQDALFPFSSSFEFREWINSAYFVDPWHPRDFGHVLIANVIAFNILEEMHSAEFLQGPSFLVADTFQDAVDIPPVPYVVPLQDLSAFMHPPKEVYIFNSKSFDFAAFQALHGSTDWSHEHTKHERYALVSRKATSKLAVRLQNVHKLNDLNGLKVEIMKSYVHFGQLSYSITIQFGMDDEVLVVGQVVIRCRWETKVSEVSTEIIFDRAKAFEAFPQLQDAIDKEALIELTFEMKHLEPHDRVEIFKILVF